MFFTGSISVRLVPPVSFSIYSFFSLFIKKYNMLMENQRTGYSLSSQMQFNEWLLREHPPN